MKKLLFVAAVAAFTMTSCKKDFTCTCTDGTNSFPYEMKDVKKKDAKEACETLNTLSSGTGTTCSLD